MPCTIDSGNRMRNIFAVRIVKIEYKFLYVLVASVVAFAIASPDVKSEEPQHAGAPHTNSTACCTSPDFR